MAAAIFVVTIVFTAIGFFGIVPSFVLSSHIYSRSIAPTSFPEKRTTSSPDDTAIPTRSASGSVARRRSGLTSFESLRPRSRASLISGFG